MLTPANAGYSGEHLSCYGLEDEKPILRFLSDLCAHEMSVYSNCKKLDRYYLFSFLDCRTDSGARVLLLASTGRMNLCDIGCFCAGSYFDAVDILFPDADESELVWSASRCEMSGFGSSFSPKVIEKMQAAIGLSCDSNSGNDIVRCLG